MGDNTEMGRLAVTEELHAKQEAARKEAERAARKAPQDAAADAKGAGEPASKKGSGEPGDVLGKTPPYQQTRATGEPSSSWLPCQVSPFAFGLPPGFSDPRRPDRLVTRSWYS